MLRSGRVRLRKKFVSLVVLVLSAFFLAETIDVEKAIREIRARRQIIPKKTVERPPSEKSNNVYHECIHGEMKNLTTVFSKRQSYDKARIGAPLTTDTTQPIRMYFDMTYVDPTKDSTFSCAKAGQTYYNIKFDEYMTCSDNDVVKNVGIINDVLKEGQNFFAKALQVKPILNGVSVSKSSECSFSNPSQSNYPGSDIVLMIFARPTTNATLAFASYCAVDQTRRPILGYINFGPRTINGAKRGTDDYRKLIYTTIHEMTHALGFSIPSYYDSEQDIMVPTSITAYNPSKNQPASITFQSIRLYGTGRIIYVMNSANVKWKAQEMMGCPTLAGAAIEDSNLPGTGGTHWEERLYMNEALTGTLDYLMPSMYSALTLAFFADTGWYSVNYDAADDLEYGKGMGCEFFNSKCNTWKGGYKCAKRDGLYCSADSRYKSVCMLSDYGSSLPSKFQYFDDKSIGGPDSTTDYCPIPSPYESCQDTSKPAFEIGLYRSYRGEKYCKNCYCFMTNSAVITNVISKGYNSAVFRETPFACHEAMCAGPDRLKVRPGKEAPIWYDCPSGEKIHMFGYTGSLTCPNATSICHGTPFQPDWPVITSVNPKSFSDNGGGLFTVHGAKLGKVKFLLVADSKATIKHKTDTMIIANAPEVYSPTGESFYAPVVAMLGDDKQRTGQIFDQYYVRYSFQLFRVFNKLGKHYPLAFFGGIIASLVLTAAIGFYVRWRMRVIRSRIIDTIKEIKKTRKIMRARRQKPEPPPE